jgi:predicted membrane channel-forming protein YqfA (hemolysin III family)
MRQFGTAKTVLSTLALLGWGLAGIAFLFVLSQLGFLQALSAIIIIAMGMFIVATAQMGLAQIATAENTAELLRIVSRTGGISKQPIVNQSASYAPILRMCCAKGGW